MLNTIIFAENPFEPETWETEEQVEDVCAKIKERFSVWPDTARIYHKQVSEANDVTPVDESTIERLQNLSGTFYVVVYPGDPTTIIIAVLAVAAAAAAAYFLMPSISGVTNRNQQSASSNNELSNRVNSPRPNQRIGDIFGTVISVPDLVALPYKIFENNIEVEHSFMCVGRGSYDISANSVRDDKTLISSIAQSKVEIYPPFTSPNSGSPQLTIGGAISTPVLNVTRSNAVNGQLLRAPNANFVRGSINIRAVHPDKIEVKNDAGVDFTDVFEVGNEVEVSGLTYAVGPSGDLAGTYTLLAVSQFELVLAVSGNWLDPDFIDVTTGWQDTLISRTETDNWVGPFVVEGSDLSQIFNNFIAPNGLFSDDGDNQFPVVVYMEIGMVQVDANDVPIGTEVFNVVNIVGSASDRETKAITSKLFVPFNGRVAVRVRRTSETDLNFPGQIVDEVKWRDLYSVAPVSNTHFGDVTTVQSVTVATAGALSVKERKLNMRVTRKIPKRLYGSTFSAELFPTNRFDEILSFVCLDKRIGNRTVAEVDFDNIYTTVAEIEEYFGTEIATFFNYTFDDFNISFEETISAIASSNFCIAYRRGNVIKLSFEKKTEDSSLLFNHRNKLPGSEVRTVRFGNQDDTDGIEIEYVSPVDGAQLTYYIPEDMSALRPKRIKTIGITSRLKAHFHAWRSWNKIRYQNTATSFEATQEADLLILRDRILVTDNTRSNSQDGEIYSQNGLELELSQPIKIEGGDYSIMLQHADATVEIIPITQGEDPWRVVLNQAPKAALAVDPALYARTTFAIVGSEDGRKTAPFLLTEKSPQSNFTLEITAINYDNRYYANDSDYNDGLIDENGN